MTNTPSFVYHRRVEFADTDMAGIVHFSRIFCYLEEAEHAFLRSVGLSVHSQREDTTISWPRLSAHCDYRGPLRFEETARVAVYVAELRRKTVRYRFEVTAADREVATGEFLVVCCEVDKGHLKSIEIPSDIVQKLNGGE